MKKLDQALNAILTIRTLIRQNPSTPIIMRLKDIINIYEKRFDKFYNKLYNK